MRALLDYVVAPIAVVALAWLCSTFLRSQPGPTATLPAKTAQPRVRESDQMPSEAATTSPVADKLPSKTACLDSNANCKIWAENGECTANAAFMSMSCPLSCGTCSRSNVGSSSSTGDASSSSSKSSTSCTDRAGAGCAGWAASGECESNPAFMLNECASSCHACDKAARCAWQADDVTPLGVPAHTHVSFVERAAALASRLSSERRQSAEEQLSSEKQLSSEHHQPHPAESKVLSHDPLVVIIDGFLSPTEVAQLRTVALGLGFEPSEINIGKGASTVRCNARVSSRSW